MFSRDIEEDAGGDDLGHVTPQRPLATLGQQEGTHSTWGMSYYQVMIGALTTGARLMVSRNHLFLVEGRPQVVSIFSRVTFMSLQSVMKRI